MIGKKMNRNAFVWLAVVMGVELLRVMPFLLLTAVLAVVGGSVFLTVFTFDPSTAMIFLAPIFIGIILFYLVCVMPEIVEKTEKSRWYRSLSARSKRWADAE